jgi:hypothetical protein
MPPPWLHGLSDWLDALLPLAPLARLGRLNDWVLETGAITESGKPLRFLPVAVQSDQPGLGYEQRIFQTGEVSTRLDGAGARHDLYNALMWLRWPRSKARLNALHARAGDAAQAQTGRGALRDAATVFDENGLVWVSQDEPLDDGLRRFDWPGLFIDQRAALIKHVRITVFGHALLHKLEAPFKGITAHGLILTAPVGSTHDEIDAALARCLTPDRLLSQRYCPLPVMGLPGWCEANSDPSFYGDTTVFRPGRMRRASQSD